ncbi:hypothetical protein Tco_1325147, partial [Tanacetum coccineum]
KKSFVLNDAFYGCHVYGPYYEVAAAVRIDNVVRGNVVSDAWKCDLEYHEVDNVVRGNVVSAAWKCDV